MRGALTAREWRHVGGMLGTVLALNLIGWGMFAVAILSQRYQLLGRCPLVIAVSSEVGLSLVALTSAGRAFTIRSGS